MMDLTLQNLVAEYGNEGRYALRWKPTAEQHALQIRVALRFDDIGQPVGRVLSSDGVAEIDALCEVSRHFFALSSDNGPIHNTATRHIPFEGTKNFRDIGGYKTIEGATVRWGKLYRSGHLSYLTDADLAKLAELELHSVFDFRDLGERQKRPNRFPERAPRENSLPIVPGSMHQFLQKAAKGELNAQFVTEFMELINRELASVYHPQYKAMFCQLIAGEGRPAVIHCAVGKDRTGLGVALILAALGVAEDIIMADYLLSNKYVAVAEDSMKLAEEVKAKTGQSIEPEHIRPMFEVHPNYLLQAFNVIKDMHGSIDKYLEERIGLTIVEREKLKSYYLE